MQEKGIQLVLDGDRWIWPHMIWAGKNALPASITIVDLAKIFWLLHTPTK